MNPPSAQMMTAALELPEEDRFELVEALLASLQPVHQPPFDESWREVIRRRSEELKSGKVQPVPWAEVQRQAAAFVADGSTDAR